MPKIAWGHIGTSNEWDDRRHVLTRTVDVGVTYDRPPLGEGEAFWSPAGERKYSLRIDGDAGKAMSLAEFCRRLEGQRSELRRMGWASYEGSEPAEFDGFINRLLDIVGILHANKCGIGLLTPENTLRLPTKAGWALVLPDLGFTWGSRQPNAALFSVVPKWISSTDYDYLWSASAFSAPSSGSRTQQWRGVAAPDGTPFDPRPDIRVLASVLASALLGSRCPPIPVATDSNGTDVPLWEVLSAAINGEYQTLEEFRGALNVARPSEHYLGRREEGNKEPPRRSWLWIAVILVVLGVSTACVAVWWWGPPPTTKAGDDHPPDPVHRQALLAAIDQVLKEPPSETPPSSPTTDMPIFPLVDKLAKIEKEKDLSQGLDVIRDMWNSSAHGPAATEAQARWIVFTSRRWLQDWKNQLRANEEKLADPLHYDEALPAIKTLSVHLNKIIEVTEDKNLKKEQQACLEYSTLVLSQ